MGGGGCFRCRPVKGKTFPGSLGDLGRFLLPTSRRDPASVRIHPSPTAGSTTAASSVSTVQGKPSLRRIKGRIHRSKSLDSIDLMDSNTSVGGPEPRGDFSMSAAQL
ncbi:hypothetical protein D4764_13G0006780 [Takifugu flavidus]|uniref:Uncharacterized protein n=1 Tax=Takifugu flavidus TaxID=433684 RepID=A0A5C6PA30_9TELE|nr:hypothetical protein D4764_13G0006780 [Takifugu flavidus]